MLIKLWPSKRPSAPPDGAFPISPPSTLLARHDAELAQIRQLAGVPAAHWEASYLRMFRAFAGFVRELPASEAHHGGPELQHAASLERSVVEIDSGVLEHHDAPMRTTLDINDATLALLREQARAAGRPLKEVVEESLRLGLSVMSRRGNARNFRVEAHDLGLKPGFRGTSLNQLYDQLEAEQDAAGS